MKNKIIVGCRGSRLSLAQTKIVMDKLIHAFPGVVARTKVVKTLGDKQQNMSVSKFTGIGIFTSALQDELRAGKIDMAVHSLKDLPTVNSYDTKIYVVERADSKDALISRGNLTIDRLPLGARLGTSSPRRASQLLAHRRDLNVKEMRGNVDTRLAKLEDGAYDAIVLAAAGVNRLGMGHKITQLLPLDIMLPAPGQGALAIEVRSTDVHMNKVARALEDKKVRYAVDAERAFLAFFGDGCSTPIGAFGEIKGNVLRLAGVIGKPDGSILFKGQITNKPSFPKEAGAKLAEKLLLQGANSIMEIGVKRSALHGKKVLVTREEEGAGLRSALLKSGAVPIYFPTITEEELADYSILDAAIRHIDSYDTVMLTSKRAAKSFFTRVRSLGKRPSSIKADFAAVGSETKMEIMSNGIVVRYAPGTFSLASLTKALKVKGKKILFPCSNRTDGAAAASLKKNGASVDSIVAYKILRARSSPARKAAITSYKGLDFVTFASPSAVKEFIGILGLERARKLLSGSTVVCIGNTTALECRKHISNLVVAKVSTINGMVSCMEEKSATKK